MATVKRIILIHGDRDEVIGNALNSRVTWIGGYLFAEQARKRSPNVLNESWVIDDCKETVLNPFLLTTFGSGILMH